MNPVKLLCDYIYHVITPRHVSYVSLFLFACLIVDQFEHVLFFCARYFFRSTINNIFFRSVEIVGMENIPAQGPLILTGNHNNQFVDGVVLLGNCRREISFLIAEKSYNRPVVGLFARAFRCIPVLRRIDRATPGRGRVVSNGTTLLRGFDTRFDQLCPGDSLEVQGVEGGEEGFRVASVTSATELLLSRPAEACDEDGVTYRILPYVDNNSMYAKVFNGLRDGKCLGIFPEGGSHDRTDLLPLKAGVANIALEALTVHNIRVPIVPVGLNYFRGHRFRGRVVVEFGTPFEIPDEIVGQYKVERRPAVTSLLNLVSTAMRSVIIPAQDYKTLQLIYLARRLYVPDGLRLTAAQTMDLNRRFAVGLRRIMKSASFMEGMEADGRSESEGLVGEKDSDQEDELLRQQLTLDDRRNLREMAELLENYMKTLKRMGLRDHQVPQVQWRSTGDLVGGLLYLIVMMALSCIPYVLFILPAIVVSRWLAARDRKKALAGSKVKITARDVVLSYKIIYTIVLVPLLYVIWAATLFFFSGLTTTSIVLLVAAAPLFTLFGVKASEQGVRAWKDALPLWKRLMPEVRQEQDKLPALRVDLQQRVRKLVRSLGPHVRELYYPKSVEWSEAIDR